MICRPAGAISHPIDDLSIGAVVHLGFPGKGRFAAHVVRREGDRYGCAFFEYLSRHTVAAAFEESSVNDLFVAMREWRLADPVGGRWPRRVRASVAIAAALVAWAAIFWLALGQASLPITLADEPRLPRIVNGLVTTSAL